MPLLSLFTLESQTQQIYTFCFKFNIIMECFIAKKYEVELIPNSNITVFWKLAIKLHQHEEGQIFTKRIISTLLFVL